MAAKDDEDERLRAAALQNAQAILRARRRAEEALRRQSEWLRITLSSIGDAVISTDAEGRVSFLNGVAEALTGWPQAEALGRPLPDVFHVVNERTRRPAEDPASRTLRENTVPGLANHTVLIARDGTERPVDDSSAPIRDEGGATLGAVLVFRDVTERKRAEDDLRRLAAELSEADRRKTEFLAMLAHELRNPLAPIRNALQLVRLASPRRRRKSAGPTTSSSARSNTWCGWSTTCWTLAGSPAARSNSRRSSSTWRPSSPARSRGPGRSSTPGGTPWR